MAPNRARCSRPFSAQAQATRTFGSIGGGNAETARRAVPGSTSAPTNATSTSLSAQVTISELIYRRRNRTIAEQFRQNSEKS